MIDLQSSTVDLLSGWGLPLPVAQALWLPLPMVVMVLVATIGALICTWLERKVSAAIQQRIGPEYAGPFGLLIPLADVIKLVIKQGTPPAKADPFLYST